MSIRVSELPTLTVVDGTTLLAVVDTSGASTSKQTTIEAVTTHVLSGNAATATKLQTARTIYGNSFDGAALNAKLTMHYNNLRLPRNKKRINKVVAEIEAGGGTSVSMLVRFLNAYGITTDVDGSLDITGSGGAWDYSKWDQFVWYNGGVNYAHLYVNGSGLGYSLSIRSSTTEDQPYIVNGIITHYLVRGLQR